MIRSAIEKMAYDIGKDIGHASDEDQANLINGLSHGLVMGCLDKLDTQICYVADLLTKESVTVIKTLADFCRLTEGEKGE